MAFKILRKDSIYLVLLLIAVGGILLYQNYQFVEDKTESIFSKLKATVSPELSLYEDSGLDVSEINLESLLPEGEEEEEEEEEQEQVIVLKPQLTLLEIQEEVNKIAKEVERIDREVQELVAFTELQKEINEITKEVAGINQEVKELT